MGKVNGIGNSKGNGLVNVKGNGKTQTPQGFSAAVNGKGRGSGSTHGTPQTARHDTPLADVKTTRPFCLPAPPFTPHRSGGKTG